METPLHKTELSQGTGGDLGKAGLTSLLLALVLSGACLFLRTRISWCAVNILSLALSLSVCVHVCLHMCVRECV